MLVVMAVQTQQFPVAAIDRVIVVIVIAVMNGQLTQVGAREFAPAATANPGINLERLLAIALFALGGGLTGVGHYAVQSVRAGRFHRLSLSCSIDHKAPRISSAYS